MLTRDSKNGIIAGVCAGLGKSLGINVAVVRLLTVLSFFVTGTLTFWGYVVAAILLNAEDK